MKTRSLFLLTLLIVLISSCAQDEMLEKRRLSMISSQDVTFNASFDEESTESRTFIEEDAETSKLYLRWTKGDEISIFRGTTLNQRFQFKGETGDNSGSFKLVPSDDFVSSNELEEARNYAFYPYDENNKISEKGELTVTLPATQTYAENSFGLGANTMIALTEHTGDVDLKFKNIGGYFKFKFYGDDLTIKSVTLKGNNGEKLTGKAGIACQYGDAPIVTMAEEATETLTLNCGAGIKVGATKEEATEFWFVLPPTKFTKGFTITVTDTDDGTFTKTTEKIFEIKRNTIKPISAMKVETVVDWEAIYAKERAALIDLYNATDGDNWKNNTNWCSDLPIDDWQGITVYSNGRIREIYLPSNKLVGKIPESIGNLTAVDRIVLSSNKLSGSIPESIGNLNNLKDLSLHNNQLSGSIPESIRNLSILEDLDLTGNQLSGSIPESIGNLSKLEYLVLSNNQLSGSVPQSIGKLTNLIHLNLRNNQLSRSISESIGELSKLVYIDLRSNGLSGSIPESIGNLINLGSINLVGNQLSGSIPESIGNLFKLEYLELSDNQLSGSIPESISNLSNLKTLGLTGIKHKFSGEIPENIGNLVELTMLNLEGLGLTGNIPESIGNLTNLTSLCLNDNQLNGNIPESIGNLTNLTELEINNNQLTGSIPESITNLTKLPRLVLEGNQLSGSIPKNIGNLTNLTILALGNNLSGEIPESIGNLTKLIVLRIGGNFSGTIPESIVNLSNLTYLSLGGKQLSGSIPEYIGNMKSLTSLTISGSQLSGEIPESIGQLTNLTYLNLSNNQLSGSIPESIGNLYSLETLVLMGNHLNGSIPESIANLSSLTFLNLKNNLFSEIPLSILNSNIWKDNWTMILPENPYLDRTNYIIPGPDFNVVDIYGETISSEAEYSKNKLTVLYLWATWCGFSNDFNKTLNKLYKDYSDKGLEIIGQDHGEIPTNDFVESNGIQWKNIVPNYTTNNLIFKGATSFPNVIVVDNNKQVVFDSYTQYRSGLFSFVQNYFASDSDEEMYTSSDYSRDGEVVTLQQATLGKGIDLTFLGEGFVDKDMESGGLYEQKMSEAMEKLFSMEPYKSMRNRFNVYAVKVVSPNAEFSPNAQHRINEDKSVCFEYAQKILPYANNNAPMVTVIYNVDYEVGRSYCISYDEDESFVAYIKEGIADVILHEVGGHGIADLLDEYVELGYESLTLPDEERIALDNVWSQYGRGANVDWRNDVATVKWAHFLSDERYANEGLGLYEGSALYGYGAYRPSENSMMRNADSPFNAPSREQIWKRIMQMSEGEYGWTYNYEDFVYYDEKNRNAASRSTSRTLTEAEKREYAKKHCPPIFIKGSWRDAMKNGKNKIVVPLR